MIDIEVPDHWGMFTPAGNKCLKKKSETFLKRIEKADTLKKQLNAFTLYFKNCRSTSSNKGMSEASDTAVREAFWDFATRVGKKIDINDYATLDKIWESKEAYPEKDRW